MGTSRAGLGAGFLLPRSEDGPGLLEISITIHESPRIETSNGNKSPSPIPKIGIPKIGVARIGHGKDLFLDFFCRSAVSLDSL